MAEDKLKICFYAEPEVYKWWQTKPQGEGGRILNGLIRQHIINNINFSVVSTPRGWQGKGDLPGGGFVQGKFHQTPDAAIKEVSELAVGILSHSPESHPDGKPCSYCVQQVVNEFALAFDAAASELELVRQEGSEGLGTTGYLTPDVKAGISYWLAPDLTLNIYILPSEQYKFAWFAGKGWTQPQTGNVFRTHNQVVRKVFNQFKLLLPPS